METCRPDLFNFPSDDAHKLQVEDYRRMKLLDANRPIRPVVIIAPAAPHFIRMKTSAPRTCHSILLTAFGAMLWLGAAGASAQTCRALKPGLEVARSALELAALEPELGAAKKQARHAKHALDEASASAQGCGCMTGYIDLDDAAFDAERASEAASVRELGDHLRSAAHHFDASLVTLKACAP
jgi:hypothetical protein